MPLPAAQAALRSLRSLFVRSSRTLGHPKIAGAVDLEDPVSGALKDAELLVAFAAQSSRDVTPEKIADLVHAAAEVSEARAAVRAPHADERTRFWKAYDQLAVEMAPLSAHSIRSSLAVNAARFPSSLFTPTGGHATLALVVFFICLALQGFWVAGKELVDRADALEKEKVELQQKLVANGALMRRGLARLDLLSKDPVCASIPCDDQGGRGATGRAQPADVSRAAGVRTEINLVRAELRDKEATAGELADELEKLNDRSRPLQELLLRWHERARGVCDAPYLRFLCPVENPKAGEEQLQELRHQIRTLLPQLEQARSAYDSFRLSQGRIPAADGDNIRMVRELGKVQSRLEEFKADLARREADQFRRIVVEIRIIVANIGTYLIAMVMGILGALAFILRSYSEQLRQHTYVPVSISVSIVRICLGAIAGVFGSMLVPDADSTLKSLPPLFIPFVFGYGIEILFSMLDKIVGHFTGGPPPAAPAGRA